MRLRGLLFAIALAAPILVALYLLLALEGLLRFCSDSRAASMTAFSCGCVWHLLRYNGCCAPVAQLDRANASEALGREFESRRAHHFHFPLLEI